MGRIGKRAQYAFMVLLMLVALIIGGMISALSERTDSNANIEALADITWELNDNGSYTLTNNIGTEKSVYAWYILDEYNEPMYKTDYSEDKTFTYDFSDCGNGKVKGFVRTEKDGDYEQSSVVVELSRIIGRKSYVVENIDALETTLTYAEKKILANTLSDKKDEFPIESVLNGTWEKWGINLAIPVEWSCTNAESRSYGFRVNGLLFLDEIYAEYIETNDEIFKEVIMDYVVDWVKQNNVVLEGENPWAWHDDATALRVFRMSYFYYLFGDTCSAEEQELIEESLENQAALLTDENFYTERHNHGMHQDWGLLVYALLLGDETVKEEYISIALERTGEYIDYVYTEDGVHKEHSPLYAGDVAFDMLLFQKITEDVAPEFSRKLATVIENAQTYMIQLIQPGGYWPSIGDSGKMLATKYESVFEGNDEWLYVSSGGKEGKRPEEITVFEDGGYAFMRSSWDDAPEETTWMMLSASTFSSTHKHSDDLSFLLYHKGELFVEAGKRDFNYAQEKTSWAYSGYAHNVLLVNGEEFPVDVGANGYRTIKSEALKTRIVESNLDGNIKSVTGVQERFENVVQYRTLSYDKENSVVTIKDTLEVKEELDATLLYHIAEGVTVEVCDNGWKLYRGEELVADVIVESENQIELKTITGEEGEFPYCTWIFNGKTEPVEGALLMVDMKCVEDENAVIITVYLK